jgi:hypothetical protein
MFAHYRAGHEVDRQRLRNLAVAVLRNEIDIDSARVRAELRRRSVRFHLEVDVAGTLSLFAGTLAEMYRDAKFALVLRDCFSWLNSFIEHQIGSPKRDALFETRFVRNKGARAIEEQVLEDAGVMVPIASALREWAAVNERVLSSVPADRMIVVRTEDLDESPPLLANFVSVPATTIRPAHANRTPSPTGLLSKVPAQFIVDQAGDHCGRIMARYWGSDWRNLSGRISTRR